MPYNMPKIIKIDCCHIKVMINVLLYLFSVFSPHKLIIESMSRVKFRVPVKIDILVVYKVSFLFKLLAS